VILVTGGAGYIGSHFVLACLAHNRSIVVLDDLSTGFRDAVPPSVPFIQGDFGAPDLLKKVFEAYDIKAVVHFAGKVVVPDSVANPLGYYDSIVTKTRCLLAHCAKFGIDEFVFSSTAAVYGTPTSESVVETMNTLPMSPYGRAKLMVEWMLADVAQAHGMRYVTLRYFNVAGADPRGRAGLRSPNATHLLKRICEVAVGLRSHVDIYGTDYDTPDGTCIRDFIHVSDLANIHLYAVDYLAFKQRSVTLNCGYGKGTSVREAIDAASRLIGQQLPYHDDARRTGDIPAIIADTTMLHETFDWSPKYNNLDMMLQTALQSEKFLGFNQQISA